MIVIVDVVLFDGLVCNDQLECVLLLINDVFGVFVYVIFEKGVEFGISCLFVSVDIMFVWIGGVSEDNFNNCYIGQWCISVWMMLNCLFDCEDQFGVSVSYSCGSDVFGLNYFIGLSFFGLCVNFVMLWLCYDIGGEFKLLDFFGFVGMVSVGFSYLLLCICKCSFWISVDVGYK